MESILMLLLGWSLGILSPSITNKIQEKKKAKNIKQSILNEADEFRITMAAVLYQIKQRANSIDHELINFLLPIYKKYSGIKQVNNVMHGLEKMQKMDSEQLSKMQQNSGIYDSLSLKKYDLPYLKTKVHEISVLENEFQRKTLEFLFLLDTFNEKVEESRFFYKLTFDGSISDDNHHIASAELENSYSNVSEQAKLILMKINALLET